MCPLQLKRSEGKKGKNHDDWIFGMGSDIYGVRLIKSRRCIEISAASFVPARHVYCPATEHRGANATF